MSTRPVILATAQAFAGGIADPVTLDEDYADVLEALDPTELLVDIRLLEHQDDAAFAVPNSAFRILGVWYDDRQLAATDMRQLESATPWWRDAVGVPRAFIVETEGDRLFRLYPAPDAPSDELSFPHGLPFGVDYPQNIVPVAYTETRDHLPDWMDLLVAFAMLSREFARESRHRDATFASAVRKLADRCLNMVR